MLYGAITVARGPASTVVVSARDRQALRYLERVAEGHKLRATVDRVARRLYFPLRDFPAFRAAVEGHPVDIDAAVEAEVGAIAKRASDIRRAKAVISEVLGSGTAELLHDFAERDRLDAHQVVAVAVACHDEVPGLCLFDEQGLGKTVTALFAFHRLRKLAAATAMLVVAPKNMVLEWVHEAERFFGATYTIAAVVGSYRDKMLALNRRADIYVTNFEATVRLCSRFRTFLEAENGRALLVVDESFFVKNAVTHRARALRRLRRSVMKCLVLCGTPAPNSPHDLVEQFSLADGGVAFDGVDVPADRTAAMTTVRGVIESRGLFVRRLKQDVLPTLPGRTFHRVLVPMAPHQAAGYAAALRSLVYDLRETDDVDFKKEFVAFLARRMALLQLCSSPGAVLANYRETPAKIAALDAILRELVERRGEKVVVWSFFTASVDTIVRRYDVYNAVRCDGTVVQAAARREAVRRFQDDDRTMLFVGNPAAAGTGLTLHRARYAVYESMSNQAAHYLQSVDRIHRRGQHRSVEYLILLCDRTIEVHEYDRLLRKEAAAQDLLGDDVEPPMTRSTMLQEAEDAALALGLEISEPPEPRRRPR